MTVEHLTGVVEMCSRNLESNPFNFQNLLLYNMYYIGYLKLAVSGNKYKFKLLFYSLLLH